MTKTTELILVILVVICALLVYEVAFDNNSNTNLEKAYAGGAGNAELLVVPFYVNGNEQKLAVFKKDEVPYKGSKLSGQWCVAIYGMRDGRKLKFEASRWIENDFFLKDYNIEERDKSSLHPESLFETKKKGEDVKNGK